LSEFLTNSIADNIEKFNKLGSGSLLYTETDGKTTRKPFYDFLSDPIKANWSDSLEELHDEQKATVHPIDYFERRTVLDYLSDYLSKTGTPIICDFGCSTGYMLNELDKAKPDSTLIGVDIIESGLIKLHKRNPNYLLFKFDITHIPFPNDFLDFIVCLNVLEHIEDDELVIKEFKRILKPEGVMCLVVPYGDKLFDYYDEACMHVRRYAKKELTKKLKNAGLQVVKHGFLNSIMYLPFSIKKRRNIRLNKDNDKDLMESISEDINISSSSLMRALFKLDYCVSKTLKFPFGIREMVLVKTANLNI